MIKKLLCSIAALCLFSACDMFDYHPYDGQIKGDKGVNARNIERIETACAGKTTIKFATMGDSQRYYDETEGFVNALNQRDDIDFVIHGGDLTDFGLTEEFTWMRDIMNKLNVPYVALIGNHDCLANGQEIFRTVFGNENFSFLAGNVKFVCLNTNALEFDYSHPIPDFGFLQNQLAEQRPGHEKTVMAMHVRPGNNQFNNNVDWVFQDVIKRFPNLQFCINAHDHRITAENLFNDGVMYYGSAAMDQKSYLVFTITPDNQYTYEVVYY